MKKIIEWIKAQLGIESYQVAYIRGFADGSKDTHEGLQLLGVVTPKVKSNKWQYSGGIVKNNPIANHGSEGEFIIKKTILDDITKNSKAAQDLADTFGLKRKKQLTPGNNGRARSGTNKKKLPPPPTPPAPKLQSEFELPVKASRKSAAKNPVRGAKAKSSSKKPFAKNITLEFPLPKKAVKGAKAK